MYPCGMRPGELPWDQVYARSLAAGAEEDLADLARAVMREAHERGWPIELRGLCGWLDEGRALIHAALTKPELAARTWTELLETEGLTGHYRGEAPEWTPHELTEQCTRCAAVQRNVRLLLPSRG